MYINCICGFFRGEKGNIIRRKTLNEKQVVNCMTLLWCFVNNRVYIPIVLTERFIVWLKEQIPTTLCAENSLILLKEGQTDIDGNHGY